jgi:uncharacterized DUF497 family protein
MGLKFEWDDKKAISNLKKHGISFEEASTVLVTGWQLQSKILCTPMTKTGSLLSENLNI